MKVTVEDVSSIQKRLSVDVPAEMVDAELDKAYRRLNKSVTIKGFRKGKAPKSVLAREYGDQVKLEVIEKIIERTLPDALKEADVTLILQPQLDDASDVKEGTPFKYSALLDLWPEFEVPQYKGLELEKPSVEVTEEEVNEQLDALRTHFAHIDDLEEDRPVEEGDLVIIDYSGTIDGEEVDGLGEENYYLEVGSGNFNEEFEESLIGMNKGDEKEIVIDYPEDALNAKVAGKTVKYKVTLKEIKKRVLPELNDEFAQKFGPNFKTVEDLKKRLRDQISKDKEEAAQASLRKQLLDKLTQDLDFPIPERLIEAKLNQMVDNVASHLQERGLDLEQAGMSEERLKEKMRDDAIEQVRTELILDKIAEKENITIDRSEISNYVDAHASQINVDRAELEAAVLQHVLPKLRANKTVEYLLEQSVIKNADESDDK